MSAATTYHTTDDRPRCIKCYKRLTGSEYALAVGLEDLRCSECRRQDVGPDMRVAALVVLLGLVGLVGLFVILYSL